MNLPNNDRPWRLLVIDDNEAIHRDFRKVLNLDAPSVADAEDEEILFGKDNEAKGLVSFRLDSAYQGVEGLDQIRKASVEGWPYVVAFVDIRMPPGWDGVETITRIWKEFPDLEVVICTAYSDYTWETIFKEFGPTDKLLILKKPFDSDEVRQLASTLVEKTLRRSQSEREISKLKSRVQERTEELGRQKKSLADAVATLKDMQAQLPQIDKMASIGQLAAGIAHEINNPIGFISSNLSSLGQYVEDLKCVLLAYEDLLGMCAQDDRYAQKTEEVERIRQEHDIEYIVSDLGSLVSESVEGVDRVRQIVADLRDFSHVDVSDLSTEDINELLNKTISVAWHELKYHTDLRRDFETLPVIKCYGGKLAQVFLNLLVNAAQAIKERGAITIRTRSLDGVIRIEVADTGSGIPSENIDRIFDPFFTTKEVGKGTGLGLHLARTIIDAHGGTISVKSEVGTGTTFQVDLPIHGPPQEKGERNAQLAPV